MSKRDKDKEREKIEREKGSEERKREGRKKKRKETERKKERKKHKAGKRKRERGREKGREREGKHKLTFSTSMAFWTKKLYTFNLGKNFLHVITDTILLELEHLSTHHKALVPTRSWGGSRI